MCAFRARTVLRSMIFHQGKVIVVYWQCWKLYFNLLYHVFAAVLCNCAPVVKDPISSPHEKIIKNTRKSLMSNTCVVPRPCLSNGVKTFARGLQKSSLKTVNSMIISSPLCRWEVVLKALLQPRSITAFSCASGRGQSQIPNWFHKTRFLKAKPSLWGCTQTFLA